MKSNKPKTSNGNQIVKNDFIITPVKGTNICYMSTSMGWLPGYPQMFSSSIKSLSSIIHKPRKIWCATTKIVRVTKVSVTMK